VNKLLLKSNNPVLMPPTSYLFLVLLVLSANALASQVGKPLFNGKNLNGWEQITGSAPYLVEKEAIVGTAVVNSPNSFLCTERPYDDFILTLEFWVDAPLNSGLMLRAQQRKINDENQLIYGYQMEIDPSPRAYTGGIYDEARRGWIYPLHYHPPARQAFQQGAWNEVRVEAVGNSLKTFINGQAAANLVDNLDDSGLICLQVHSIGPGDLEGKQVRWRNIIIQENPADADRSKLPLGPQVNLIPNTLTQEERNHGWRLLWDGESNEGWHGVKLAEFPKNGWFIEDNELRVEKSDGGESTNGGDIVTIDHFSDFELSFEFRPTKGANSGVKYLVNPSLNKGTGSAIGLEFQILDDELHPDAKMGVAGNRTMGSLYDLISAEVIDVPERGKEFKVGDWNRGRILVKGGHVEHWLNGFKVVEYDRYAQLFKAVVNHSKYKDWEHFGRWPSGPILLQDHGDQVSFRSIKIREF
jgi:hypothetical protein